MGDAQELALGKSAFRDFDDYWQAFKAAGDRCFRVLLPFAAGETSGCRLPNGKPGAGGCRLEADGRLRLVARAWAVKGKAAAKED
ncbi:MAG: hypothetical protein M1347_05785 [Chloroflexi bacterium]|nr:hypothetical protein [Chloroflexota bacterium]